MSEKKLGQLLDEAAILQPAAKLTGDFGRLNATLVEMLNRFYVEKQELEVEYVKGRRTHDRPEDWFDNYVITYGSGYRFIIPTREIPHWDGKLNEKIRRKIMSSQIEEAVKYAYMRTQERSSTQVRIGGSPVMSDDAVAVIRAGMVPAIEKIERAYGFWQLPAWADAYPGWTLPAKVLGFDAQISKTGVIRDGGGYGNGVYYPNSTSANKYSVTGPEAKEAIAFAKQVLELHYKLTEEDPNWQKDIWADNYTDQCIGGELVVRLSQFEIVKAVPYFRDGVKEEVFPHLPYTPKWRGVFLYKSGYSGNVWSLSALILDEESGKVNVVDTDRPIANFSRVVFDPDAEDPYEVPLKLEWSQPYNSSGWCQAENPFAVPFQSTGMFRMVRKDALEDLYQKALSSKVYLGDGIVRFLRHTYVVKPGPIKKHLFDEGANVVIMVGKEFNFDTHDYEENVFVISVPGKSDDIKSFLEGSGIQTANGLSGIIVWDESAALTAVRQFLKIN